MASDAPMMTSTAGQDRAAPGASDARPMIEYSADSQALSATAVAASIHLELEAGSRGI